MSVAYSRMRSQLRRKKRRKFLLDPSKRLFHTHRLRVGDTNIDTAELFSDRFTPVTFEFVLRRSSMGAAPSGIVFEMGNATCGVAVWVDGTDVGFAFGNSTGNGGGSYQIRDLMLRDDKNYHFVFSIATGRCDSRAWAEEDFSAGLRCEERLDNGWCMPANGAVGQVNGTCTTRVPVASRGPLTNCGIVGEIQVSDKQRPWWQDQPRHEIAAYTPPKPLPLFDNITDTYTSLVDDIPGFAIDSLMYAFDKDPTTAADAWNDSGQSATATYANPPVDKIRLWIPRGSLTDIEVYANGALIFKAHPGETTEWDAPDGFTLSTLNIIDKAKSRTQFSFEVLADKPLPKTTADGLTDEGLTND